jgi:hypothetical protein
LQFKKAQSPQKCSIIRWQWHNGLGFWMADIGKACSIDKEFENLQ